jgi:Ca2+-binding EF-hand superfamily protein
VDDLIQEKPEVSQSSANSAASRAEKPAQQSTSEGGWVPSTGALEALGNLETQVLENTQRQPQQQVQPQQGLLLQASAAGSPPAVLLSPTRRRDEADDSELQLNLSAAKAGAETAVVAVFSKIDLDGDGLISKSEFKSAFEGKWKDKLKILMIDTGVSWEEVKLAAADAANTDAVLL